MSFKIGLMNLKNLQETMFFVGHQGMASVMAVHLFKAKYPMAIVLSLDGGISGF